MNECVFCRELAGGKNEFARSNNFRARWDLYPVTPGHVEIVPLRHVQFFEELTEDELAEMLPFARKVRQVMKDTNLVDLYRGILATDDLEINQGLVQAALAKAERHTTSFDAVNFGINDGPAAGQSVPHLHLHIMPRWAGDVENPRGGVRNIFANDIYRELK